MNGKPTNIILSLHIDDLPGLNDHEKEFFRRHGVVYLGVYFAFAHAYKKSIPKKKIPVAILKLDTIVHEIGFGQFLSDEYTPAWTPPYFGDKKFLEALNMPILDVIESHFTAADYHLQEIHYLGQVLVNPKWGRDNIPKGERLQKSLGKLTKSTGIHSWMWRPLHWTSPVNPPKSWKNYIHTWDLPNWGKEQGSCINDLLLPIPDLELSVRTETAIKKTGAVFVGDLVQLNEEKMRQTRRAGGYEFCEKSLKEIRETLSYLELILGIPSKHPLIIEFERRKAV